MAIYEFASHIAETGEKLRELRRVIGDLDEILARHNHNGYTSVLSSEFDTEQVTKAEYDAATSSISNLVNTWLPAGHGTNIDGYLFEIPELTP